MGMFQVEGAQAPRPRQADLRPAASPRPQDRVFTTYNYYNNVNGALAPPGQGQTDVHREVIGFEKTFLNGNASIGLRAPYVEVTGDPGIAHQNFGDLSLVLKYAFINCQETGNVLSAGLVVTAPTGSSFLPAGVPDIHSNDWLFQPWVGAIYNMGNIYVLGFSSVVIPTQSQDVTFVTNDLGIGWRAYQCEDRCLRSVIFTVEGHLTNPLNHRGAMTFPIGLQDIFDMTFGVRFGICDRTSFGIAAGLPLSGPKPYDFEILAALNFRF
jgi:hypothetical protein